MEITTAEQNKGKRMKRIEDDLRDLWDNFKHTNIRIIGVPKKLENSFAETKAELKAMNSRMNNAEE